MKNTAPRVLKPPYLNAIRDRHLFLSSVPFFSLFLGQVVIEATWSWAQIHDLLEGIKVVVVRKRRHSSFFQRQTQFFRPRRPRSICKANALSKFMAQWPHENAASPRHPHPPLAAESPARRFSRRPWVRYNGLLGCMGSVDYVDYNCSVFSRSKRFKPSRRSSPPRTFKPKWRIWYLRDGQ